MYDVFSKFTKIYPMKAINTRGCLKKVLEEYLPRYGRINAFMAYNASLFSSLVWRRTLEENELKCYHPSLYHHQGNPSERSIRNICLYLRAYCHDKHTEWHAYCPLVEAIINRTPNPTTQVSPEKLMTGKEPESLFANIPTTVPIPGQVEQNEMQRVYHHHHHHWRDGPFSLTLASVLITIHSPRSVTFFSNLLYQSFVSLPVRHPSNVT